MNMSTAYQVREPRIHTLQSYINDEPIDYVKQNGTDIQDIQNINKLKNASDTLQTAHSQALTNIPDDFDLDQFLKGSIAEINAQVVGVDDRNSKKLSSDVSDSPGKVYTQIKQPYNNVNNYLYGQNNGKPKVQTLDEILKQSISKMDYISEQCQQTMYSQPITIDNNTNKQNSQRQKQVDFNMQSDVVKTFNTHNQYEQKDLQSQEDIIKNVNFDFDVPTYDNLFDEKIIAQQQNNQQPNNYSYYTQDTDIEQLNQYSNARPNPRQRAINKTNEYNDSFQYIAHRIPSMRNETRESKVLKSQLQNKALQDEIAAIRKIQCEQSAQIAMQRKQIQSELKKYQKWMLQTFDIDIDQIINQRDNDQVQGTLFNPGLQQSNVQQTKAQQSRSQSNQLSSNRQSTVQKQQQKRKITPSAVRSRILQQSNISRSNSKTTNQYSQIKSQYSQQNLAKHGVKQKNQSANKTSRGTKSQPSSRASSRDSDTNRCTSQISRSIVRSAVLNTPQSIKAGMRNNILNKQMEVVEPKRDDAVYYRQMLQKQLYQQKLEEQRKQKALQQQMEQDGQQYTFKPQINQRPAYLDQMQKFQKSNVQQSFYDQDTYLTNPPYLQNSAKQKNIGQNYEYTIEQYEEDEKYLEEQIKTLNSQLQQSQMASFRGKTMKNEQNVQYMNKNAIQNRQNFMQHQQQKQMKQQQYNQNSYKPTINKIDNDQMTQGLKKYLDTPVYDRLQNRQFNSRSNTPQQEPEKQQQKKMTTTDFKNFLARQTASQQKKMKNILLKQAESESDVIAKANMNKMNRQSELYLKYRNMIGNSQRNSTGGSYNQRSSQVQKGPTGYNQYQNKVLNNIYDIQIGEQRQFEGQIW